MIYEDCKDFFGKEMVILLDALEVPRTDCGGQTIEAKVKISDREEQVKGSNCLKIDYIEYSLYEQSSKTRRYGKGILDYSSIKGMFEAVE